MGRDNRAVRHNKRGGKKRNEDILKEMYEIRETTNKFYFGGQDRITKQYHHPRFKSRHDRSTLDNLWYPFL